MARPMPLEAPVTRAARAGMGANQSRPGLLSVAMPLVIIAVLAVVLAAAALAFDGGDERHGRGASAAGAARADRRARRAGARAALPAGARSARGDAGAGRRRRRSSRSTRTTRPPAAGPTSEVLGLLGLLPPGTDLREAAESTYGEAVAGYYDPRSGRLRVVQGAQTGNRVLYEMTLAHELDHALEDQRLELDADAVAGSDDASLAYTALVEGSATALMYRYVDDRFGDEETFGGLARLGVRADREPAAVPDGAARVPLHAGRDVREPAARARLRRLVRRGHGAARPAAGLDRAGHAPAGLRRRRPAAARADRAARWAAGACCAAGRWGSGPPASCSRAPAGRPGPRRRRAGAATATRCCGRGADRALVVRWVWDTPGDEREFLPALRDWVRGGEAGVRGGRDRRVRRRRDAGDRARRRAGAGARAGAALVAPAPRATSLPPCGAPVAQRSEQRAHNPTDGGSNPPRRIALPVVQGGRFQTAASRCASARG